ncbi:kinase-like domain-containing protein [Pelagophyceae sp. CCMP2097]|nr:kinase-like domain-containing protein [Pelagophyceae sp. CCMP2097]
MIDPSEIVLHHVIGEGSFGRVWAATWQSSQVAVKEFVLAQAAFAGGSFQRRDIIEEIVGEAGIMAYLRHPKILQLYGCSLTAQAIWIVSELCAHGSLRQVLDDPTKQLSLAKRLRMAIDVAEGMLYLHTREKPIVHRDLKSHNLFVAEHHGRMNVRIGDWGSARAVAMTPNSSRTMTHGVGTTCWLAPELIKDAKGSERIDVYAFGIVLWEIATREEVYPALSAAQIISRVANEGMRPPLPIGCPWNHVMQQCWAEDPQDRPAFEAIFQQLTEIHRRLVERRKRVKRRRAREASASSETSSGASAGDRSSGASADGDDDSDSDS